ncbi:MAG TPA: dihydrolipoamide acetyltransferase family protein [Aestuariivirgaceae bacterium]|nr:dihydrolipoamide acetyltransferase family protein [Aestuariivirgaceae bacterium]
MAERIIKLPDVGEGVAEAELVEWHVKVGDMVREDSVLAAVMTDKATVEIPAPADGTVSWLGAEVGETIAVGSPLIKLDVAGEAGGDETLEATAREEAPKEGKVEQEAEPEPPPAAKPEPKAEPAKPKAGAPARASAEAGTAGAPRPEGERPLASPSVRRRAKEAGVDLRQVPGTGSAGRIGHEDLDGFIARGRQPAARGLSRNTEVEEIKVVGMRRRIAERMALSKARIAHITYVEEVDVTALEDLRSRLNAEKAADRPRLTMLPFLMRAIVKAVAEQPMVNAHYDDEANVIHRHGGIHIGVATQTAAGLMVPVVRHAEARDLWDCARELNRLAEAAKNGSAARDELSGSTITVTSLGALGGIASTPVINPPEVAIVGVNKMEMRPVWDGQQFVPRKMMNLSSSFDHRVIDGWNAAVFVQRIKTLLETPAMIFLET